MVQVGIPLEKMNNHTKTYKDHNKKEKVNYSELIVGSVLFAILVLAIVR